MDGIDNCILWGRLVFFPILAQIRWKTGSLGCFSLLKFECMYSVELFIALKLVRQNSLT